MLLVANIFLPLHPSLYTFPNIVFCIAAPHSSVSSSWSKKNHKLNGLLGDQCCVCLLSHSLSLYSGCTVFSTIGSQLTNKCWSNSVKIIVIHVLVNLFLLDEWISPQVQKSWTILHFLGCSLLHMRVLQPFIWLWLGKLTEGESALSKNLIPWIWSVHLC